MTGDKENVLRISVDGELCQGHARCCDQAPELFDLDDLGHSVVLFEEVPHEHEKAARAAVASCPERAIRIATP